ncbi:MAG: carboxymuconolactone decarboxylase family protein [Candidatus Bathyarchaeia archaeon]|jgi:AhpD family alkylhydroperoxidase
MVYSEKEPIKPKPNRLLRKLPEVAQRFNQMHGTIMSSGALSEKTKELIAVGISVAIRCQPCIQNHVSAAVKMGNSQAEILEAISVGILMGGGPAYAYASEAIELLNSLFVDKKEESYKE